MANDIIKAVDDNESARMAEQLKGPEALKWAGRNSRVFSAKEDDRPLYERGQVRGIVFHRYFQGKPLQVNQYGAASVDYDDKEIKYTWEVKPLHRRLGVKICSVWGQEDKPGSIAHREDLSTRTLHSILKDNSAALGIIQTAVPAIEVRSIKIGETEDGITTQHVMLLLPREWCNLYPCVKSPLHNRTSS